MPSSRKTTQTAVLASGNSGAIRVGPPAQFAAAQWDKATFVLNVVNNGGTLPTLDAVIEWSNDGGVTFIAPSTAIAFTQVTTTDGSEMLDPVTVQGEHYRLVWTLGGTGPDYTFSLDEYVS
jgi:hypothetical protein